MFRIFTFLEQLQPTRSVGSWETLIFFFKPWHVLNWDFCWISHEAIHCQLVKDFACQKCDVCWESRNKERVGKMTQAWDGSWLFASGGTCHGKCVNEGVVVVCFGFERRVDACLIKPVAGLSFSLHSSIEIRWERAAIASIDPFASSASPLFSILGAVSYSILLKEPTCSARRWEPSSPLIHEHSVYLVSHLLFVSALASHSPGLIN